MYVTYHMMRNTLQHLLDVLFPPSGEALVVKNLADDISKSVLRPQTFLETVTLTDFKDPRIRALIHEAKFHQNKKAIMILGEILATYLSSHASLKNLCVVPTPLSRARMRARGHNQVLSIIEAAATHTPFEYAHSILIRTHNTKPQTELPKSEREKNVEGAFKVTKPDAVVGKHILLVDDVVTTGSTLKAAKAQLLRHSPAKITTIALAH